MNPSTPPGRWLVATLVAAAWASDAHAGQTYNFTYAKALGWQFPAGANVAKVAGTVTWVSTADARDVCHPPEVSMSNAGMMMFVPPQKLLPFGAADAVTPDVEAHAAQALMASMIVGPPPFLTITSITHVQGLANDPTCKNPVGFNFATSSATNDVSVAGATLIAAATSLNGGKFVAMPLLPGLTDISTGVLSSTLIPKASVSDPITETIVDQRTGASMTQQVFSLGNSTANGEVSVRPRHGRPLHRGSPWGCPLQLRCRARCGDRPDGERRGPQREADSTGWISLVNLDIGHERERDPWVLPERGPDPDSHDQRRVQ